MVNTSLRAYRKREQVGYDGCARYSILRPLGYPIGKSRWYHVIYASLGFPEDVFLLIKNSTYIGGTNENL